MDSNSVYVIPALLDPEMNRIMRGWLASFGIEFIPRWTKKEERALNRRFDPTRDSSADIRKYVAGVREGKGLVVVDPDLSWFNGPVVKAETQEQLDAMMAAFVGWSGPVMGLETSLSVGLPGNFIRVDEMPGMNKGNMDILPRTGREIILSCNSMGLPGLLETLLWDMHSPRMYEWSMDRIPTSTGVGIELNLDTAHCHIFTQWRNLPAAVRAHPRVGSEYQFPISVGTKLRTDRSNVFVAGDRGRAGTRRLRRRTMRDIVVVRYRVGQERQTVASVLIAGQPTSFRVVEITLGTHRIRLVCAFPLIAPFSLEEVGQALVRGYAAKIDGYEVDLDKASVLFYLSLNSISVPLRYMPYPTGVVTPEFWSGVANNEDLRSTGLVDLMMTTLVAGDKRSMVCFGPKAIGKSGLARVARENGFNVVDSDDCPEMRRLYEGADHWDESELVTNFKLYLKEYKKWILEQDLGEKALILCHTLEEAQLAPQPTLVIKLMSVMDPRESAERRKRVKDPGEVPLTAWFYTRWLTTMSSLELTVGAVAVLTGVVGNTGGV